MARARGAQLTSAADQLPPFCEFASPSATFVNAVPLALAHFDRFCRARGDEACCGMPEAAVERYLMACLLFSVKWLGYCALLPTEEGWTGELNTTDLKQAAELLGGTRFGSLARRRPALCLSLIHI